MKKKYQNELESLKRESQEFREQYVIQMREVNVRLEHVLYTNVNQCQDTFSKFYDYSNHKLKSESKIVNNNKEEFVTMNVQNQFRKYLNTEIPKFEVRCLLEDYKLIDPGQALMEQIDTQLNKKPRVKLQNTFYFQDTSNMSQYSIDSKSARGQTMRMKRIDADDNSSESTLEIEQSIQTDFYNGLKEDINVIILKAWDGQQ